MIPKFFSMIKSYRTSIMAYAFVIASPILSFLFLVTAVFIGPILNITFQTSIASVEGLAASCLWCFAGFAIVWAFLHDFKQRSPNPFRMTLVEISANVVVTFLAALIFGRLDDDLFRVVYPIAVIIPSLVYLIAYLFKRFVWSIIQPYTSAFALRLRSRWWLKLLGSIASGLGINIFFVLHLIVWHTDNIYVGLVGGILCMFLLVFWYVQIRTAASFRFLAGSIGAIGGLLVSLSAIYRVSLPMNEVTAIRFLLAVALFWLTVGLLCFEIFCSFSALLDRWEKQLMTDGT